MALTILRMSVCVPSHVCDKNGSEEVNVLLIWYLKPKWSKALKTFAQIRELELEVEG